MFFLQLEESNAEPDLSLGELLRLSHDSTPEDERASDPSVRGSLAPSEIESLVQRCQVQGEEMGRLMGIGNFDAAEQVRQTLLQDSIMLRSYQVQNGQKVTVSVHRLYQLTERVVL